MAGVEIELVVWEENGRPQVLEVFPAPEPTVRPVLPPVESPPGRALGMNLVSRIAGRLSENEATISSVVGIAVLTGIRLHE